MKAWFKKVARSIFAALSTPEAVKAEKSILVIALVRLAILVPAAAQIIDIVVKWLNATL